MDHIPFPLQQKWFRCFILRNSLAEAETREREIGLLSDPHVFMVMKTVVTKTWSENKQRDVYTFSISIPRAEGRMNPNLKLDVMESLGDLMTSFLVTPSLYKGWSHILTFWCDPNCSTSFQKFQASRVNNFGIPTQPLNL